MRRHFVGRISLAALAGLAGIALGACQSSAPDPPAGASGTPGTVEGRNADQFLVVDCLLPGKVRKLGAGATYVTPRRPVKTSARDCEIRGGEYTAFDRATYAGALRVWLPLAESGDPEAQTYVGEIFERGVEGVPDPAAAVMWYTRAAEQGYGPAQLNLGSLYDRGAGVKEDAKKAREWYRRAAGLQNVDDEYVTFVTDAKAQEQLRSQLARSDTESRALRKRVKQLEHDAAAARERYETRVGEAEPADHGEQIEKRKRELDQLDAEVKRLAREAEQRRSEYSRRVRSETREVALSPGPSLHLVDPSLPLTRASNRPTIFAAGSERRIVGRVEAPAGLLTLLVNGVEEKAGSDGFFETKLRVRPVGTPVEIVAVDQQGKRVNRQFVIKRKTGEAGATSSPQPVAVERGASAGSFGRYNALVIGNSRYAHLDQLPSATADARAVAEVLERKYGFRVIALYDADRYAILSALNELRTRLDEHDNLVVYYAGHGALDEVNQRGHWLPVDAQRGNPANWISNVAITDIFNAMKAKHVMVIADSCYSGALTESGIALAEEELGGDARTMWQKTLIARRSRTALTSGGLAPVLDEGEGGHSIFARAFLDVLNNSADVLEGRRLYQEVAAQVAFRARARGFQQEPRYAPIRFGRHEGGDFFFVPKR